MNSELVGVKSETRNGTFAFGSDEGGMPKFFAGKNIGNMYFDNGCGDGSDGIAKRNGGMCVPSCIEEDALMGEPYLMKLVDEFALHIALKIAQLDLWKNRLEVLKIGKERL